MEILLNRSVFIEDLLSRYDIVCLQEHFATSLSLPLLNLSPNHQVFTVAAKRSRTHGRPSGGLATYVRSSLSTSMFDSALDFLAVKIQDMVIVNVYLPTDYRDDRSDRLFAISIARLSKCIDKIKKHGLSCLITGDFNCDLENPSGNNSSSSNRANMLLGMLGDEFILVSKNKNFSYIHNSGSMSNLDHVMHTQSLTPSEVLVSDSNFTSDHFPLFFNIDLNSSVPPPPGRLQKRPYFVCDWKRASMSSFQSTCDELVSKIRVPFDLLMVSSKNHPAESRIRLNIYCGELVHALRLAEQSAVPSRRVWPGTEVPGWSANVNLQNACSSAKFWLSVWREAGCPRDGWVNKLRIHSKRKFAKELSLHRSAIIRSSSQAILTHPNKLWSSLFKERSHVTMTSISRDNWVQHYRNEFSAPDIKLQKSFGVKLDDFFSRKREENSPGVIITRCSIRTAIRKLKKKKSRGCDGISIQHLLFCSELFLEHLALLFQIIFNLGIVPDSFSIGILTPVPKKGKPLSQCSSFRPITVATVFCKLFEALIVDELRSKCTVPDHQFGFQPSLGCGHALSALVSALIDAEKSGESIALAAHDVRRAFDSLIHEQIILDMGLAGVDPSMLNPLYDMYKNLKARLKLPITLGPKPDK